MVAEEGREDMTNTSEFTVECDVETEGAGGENGEMPVVVDKASITTDDMGSENNSVSII